MFFCMTLNCFALELNLYLIIGLLNIDIRIANIISSLFEINIYIIRTI